LDLAKLPFQDSFSTAQAAVVRVSLTADVEAMATTLPVSRSVRQNA
jgi:hypothetical protein